MQIPNLVTVFKLEQTWNFKNYRFFVISWFDLISCISVTLRIWEMVWGTFLLSKWCRSLISKPFSKSELIWNFKNYRFFVISWFDLISCISVTQRIWEMVWGTFFAQKVMQIPNLVTVFKLEQTWNFKNYRFLINSWFDLISCISVTQRIWEMVWGTFLLKKWCRSRIS